ncbi:hypothetical protein [Trichormus variabilis]|uniref:Uncharacterized protein n=1 Tax=Trichormus variabilis SAG 1403-4b TaxID=447716 RepID=A0A3S1CI72_ANAVA|nr:hypothetical protein [Trichormus variabilis]MBD2629673.1 hypothetical protein [Trichormus variabilis FACHB-164]RUS92909.1 hypothetical protein DSM107003_46560 [Trichormus variabilis SAG 1403-4b]
MSLTSELNNPESHLSQWFLNRASYIGYKIVEAHNQQMALRSIIRPIAGTDFPKVGTACCYYLRKYLSALDGDWNNPALSGDAIQSLGKVSKRNSLSVKTRKDWLQETVAGMVIAKLKLNVGDYIHGQSSSVVEEAYKMLILAHLEQWYRSRSFSNLLKLSFSTGKIIMPSGGVMNEWIPSIQDIAQIIQIMPSTWQTLGFVPDTIKSNVTFPHSSDLGGADCQIIANNAIVDIRVTAKKQPFTLNNLYQQVAYLLMDTNDEHQINQLIWFYPRQQVIFTYPVKELFTDLKKTRREFSKFLNNHY